MANLCKTNCPLAPGLFSLLIPWGRLAHLWSSAKNMFSKWSEVGLEGPKVRACFCCVT
jgi:hypothetical protein